MIGSCRTKRPHGITKWLVLVSLESELQKSCSVTLRGYPVASLPARFSSEPRQPPRTDCSGIDGRFGLESVDELDRNQWIVCSGISGRVQSEWVDDLGRNMYLLLELLLVYVLTCYRARYFDMGDGNSSALLKENDQMIEEALGLGPAPSRRAILRRPSLRARSPEGR